MCFNSLWMMTCASVRGAQGSNRRQQTSQKSSIFVKQWWLLITRGSYMPPKHPFILKKCVVHFKSYLGHIYTICSMYLCVVCIFVHTYTLSHALSCVKVLIIHCHIKYHVILTCYIYLESNPFFGWKRPCFLWDSTRSEIIRFVRFCRSKQFQEDGQMFTGWTWTCDFILNMKSM